MSYTDYVDDSNVVSYALTMEESKPLSYREVIQSNESTQWLVSMKEEMLSLEKNRTWELVPLLKGIRPAGCKWVFKMKERIHEFEPPKFKARFLAKRY